MRKATKIIATIGPASDSIEMIGKLYEAGMDVARLNFSHGSHSYFKNVIQRIRKVSKEITIVLDTKGPEIRSGEIDNGTMILKGGDRILLTRRQVKGTPRILTINYNKLDRVGVGNKMLIDDGLIALKIVKSSIEGLTAEVLNGGTLGSRKTVCVQDHNVELPFMSAKDRQDIAFGIRNGVDYIAASFVRKPKDITQLRKEIKGHARIISKIEHWEAVHNLDEIIRLSDGIMIARGDLGIEIPMQKVPGIQAMAIGKCNSLGKPVIVATQMLESMKENPRPTRAEVADISQAILQGADSIMLSGETASGKYPIESVRMMVTIAKEYDRYVQSSLTEEAAVGDDIALFVTHAAHHASEHLKTAAILTPTYSGFTARKVARFKPNCPIYAFVQDMRIFRQLKISWGVTPIFVKRRFKSPSSMIRYLIRKIYKDGLVKIDDRIVITAGLIISRGHTNLLEIYTVRDVVG